MVLQNKTANKGRAANVRASIPLHIPRVVALRLFTSTPDSRAENTAPVDQAHDLWPADARVVSIGQFDEQ